AMRYVLNELEPALDEARREVAAFVGAAPAELAFVTNPTTGVGAVLASIALRPDDEVLITDHGYNACNNAARYWTERAGAKVAIARVPFPVRDTGEVLDAILAAVTPKTRFAIVDQVTSPTALVLPIGELVRELQVRNVEVLVDGAHSPGMLPLDIASLGAEYFVGTLHKWCCAPKGVSILHVRSDKQSRVHPLVISHGYNSTRTDRSRYHLEFDWVGSHDPSGFLAAPAALRYLAGLLPGGLPALMERNRALALAARTLLADKLGLGVPCPESMLGSMAALFLPDDPSPQSKPGSPFSEPLTSSLRDRYRFEVPVMLWPTASSRLVRISAGPYNHLAQYERLAEAIRAEVFGV
ncbi:MAG TPA: aminotransferase class V-fold PLP-dependent enzyme, partial [Polyangiaceae bacterium]|nr:aminotransferase class V-fold PLP-dependent enzyme [Polyangiaceae bacterium]